MRSRLPGFLQHLAVRRSPRTAKTYGAIVESFFAFSGSRQADASAALTRADAEAFLGRPRRDGRRAAPATRNQELAALRAFSKFAELELGWTASPTVGIPFAREAPRDPAVLSAPELRRMFSAADQVSRAGCRARNLAILAVLSHGLRVHELVGLDVAQIDLASSTLVGVNGKGGTLHDLPLNAPTVALLIAWLAERAARVPDTELALFVSSRGTRLSIRAVQRLVVRLREQIGTAKQITPHTFRHSAATLALSLGVDLSTVGDLLRHADLNTTRRYLHLVDERRRDAVRRLATAIPVEFVAGAATEPVNDTARRVDSQAPTAHQRTSENDAEGLDVQHGLDDVA